MEDGFHLIVGRMGGSNIAGTILFSHPAEESIPGFSGEGFGGLAFGGSEIIHRTGGTDLALYPPLVAEVLDPLGIFSGQRASMARNRATLSGPPDRAITTPFWYQSSGDQSSARRASTECQANGLSPFASPGETPMGGAYPVVPAKTLHAQSPCRTASKRHFAKAWKFQEVIGTSRAKTTRGNYRPGLSIPLFLIPLFLCNTFVTL
jgi:hypothetical protein